MRKILASPESLRGHLLAGYRALLRRLDEDLPAGRGVAFAQYLGIPRHPLEHRPPDLSKRPLSPGERARLHQEAREEVERRAQTVELQYRLLHAALEKAFPLRSCLED